MKKIVLVIAAFTLTGFFELQGAARGVVGTGSVDDL